MRESAAYRKARKLARERDRDFYIVYDREDREFYVCDESTIEGYGYLYRIISYVTPSGYEYA